MGKINANSRTVDELLSHRYEVDYYQREYRWETKQVAELLDDLVARFQDSYEPGDERKKVANYESYFLGSVVVAERGNARFIVDGQQRLTTLTLLLVHLHQVLENYPTLAQRIFSMQYGEEEFNIAVPEREPAMRAIYRNEPYDPAAESDPSARNIWDRYTDIKDRFRIDETAPDGSEPVAHFTDWLLNRVVLVEIIATAEEDAYTVFETMNDRGLSLSQAEMLKGYLLSRLADDERDAVNGLWRERMLDLIKLSKDDELDVFKAWLRARHAATIRERKKNSVNRDWDQIGTGFHKWVREQAGAIGLHNGTDHLRFVKRDFERYSRHYLQARDRSSELTPGHEAVFFNAQNGFTLQFTLMLSPVLPDDSEDVADAKMRAVANYLDVYVARRIVNYKTLAYSSIVYTMFGFMKELRAHEELGDLQTFLRTKLEELPEQFDEASFGQFRRHQQNQGFVYKLLARMTYYVERESAKPTSFLKYLDRSAAGRYDTEHIWPDKLDDYVARFPTRFASREQAAQFRDRVGGLVLLPEKVNRSLQAKPYEQKVGKYLEDNLLAGSLHADAYIHNPGFTSFVAKSGLPFEPVSDFDADALDARQELYRRLCEAVWDPNRVLR